MNSVSSNAVNRAIRGWELLWEGRGNDDQVYNLAENIDNFNEIAVVCSTNVENQIQIISKSIIGFNSFVGYGLAFAAAASENGELQASFDYNAFCIISFRSSTTFWNRHGYNNANWALSPTRILGKR